MARTFDRGGARYKEQPKVLIICEDSKSAVRYLNDAKVHFRIQFKVQVTHCGKTDPKGIVTEAIAQLKNYDRVYCAIDRDAHENFDEAINLAQTSPNVFPILSYPCFEFWYLLHFRFTRTPFKAAGKKSAGDRLLATLRACDGMGKYSKGSVESVFEALLPKLSDARRDSPRIRAHAIEEQNLNPSTQVHELFDYFDVLRSPQPK